MEDIIRKRINDLLDEMGLTPNSISRNSTEQRKLNRQFNEEKTLTVDALSRVLDRIPDASAEWLLRGEGDMLKNSGTMTGSNQGEGNKIEYKNGGNVGVGNTVNVTLPKSGTQKIINPDGSVELTSIGSNGGSSDKLQRENESLKEEISHLMDKIKLKDELIASQRDIIELLKHKQ